MKTYTKIIIAIVILALLGGTWYWFTEKSDNRQNEVLTNETEVVNVPTVTPGIYKSNLYLFSFAYDHNILSVSEETPEKIVIKNVATSTNENPIAVVELIIESRDVEVPFEQFVLDESRLLCSKTDPEFSCKEINDLSSFTNASGIEATKFYMMLEEGGSSREKGPFIAINNSPNTPGKISFILVHPPLQNAGSVKVIESIANALKF
jgi:hypothetical protein